MGEVLHARVNSICYEIKGDLIGLEAYMAGYYVVPERARRFNDLMDDLSNITSSDYGSHKLSAAYFSDEGMKGELDVAGFRQCAQSVVSRLVGEYNLNEKKSETATPLVVNITNQNSMQVTYTPIEEVINSQSDEELKVLLLELKEELGGKKEKTKVQKTLNKIASRSWQVFLQVLPYVLQKYGHTNK
jgi:hypothetical protein